MTAPWLAACLSVCLAACLSLLPACLCAYLRVSCSSMASRAWYHSTGESKFSLNSTSLVDDHGPWPHRDEEKGEGGGRERKEEGRERGRERGQRVVGESGKYNTMRLQCPSA